MTQWNETSDKREILHARIFSKFGQKLKDFESVVLASTELPVEVCCKEHGPYMLRPNRAMRWRGKGAPYCPECGKAGRPKGSKTRAKPVKAEMTPAEKREALIKGLLSRDSWISHFKVEDISIEKWRKLVRPKLEVIDPDLNMDAFEFMHEGRILLNELKGKLCST